jgi:hypothetical protein
LYRILRLSGKRTVAVARSAYPSRYLLDGESLGADLRHRKVAADLSGQAVWNLLMSRHALDRAGSRIAP